MELMQGCRVKPKTRRNLAPSSSSDGKRCFERARVIGVLRLAAPEIFSAYRKQPAGIPQKLQRPFIVFEVKGTPVMNLLRVRGCRGTMEEEHTHEQN